MAVQTTYNATISVGYPGMVSDMRNVTLISREVMATSSPMPFGGVALRGNTDHTIGLIGTSGVGAFLGISVYDDTVRPANGSFYVAGDTAAVMIRGVIWVTVTSTVTPGSAAYYDSSGNITATSTSNTAIPNGVFETSAASGALAVLRIVA
jgi:hypothetical protein